MGVLPFSPYMYRSTTVFGLQRSLLQRDDQILPAGECRRWVSFDQVHDKFLKRPGNTHRKRKNRRSHQLQVFRTNDLFKRHHKRISHLQDSSWMEPFRIK